MDTFGSGQFCREVDGAVKILYCWSDAEELVDFVNCFHCIWAIVIEIFKVGKHFCCQWGEVEEVE